MATSKGKDHLRTLLNEESPKPAIRRGQGFQLSTEAPAAEVARTDTAPTDVKGTRAHGHTGTDAPEGSKRSTRGFRLRDDLVKDCKKIAVHEERKLYEVMEEALQEYLARKAGAPTSAQDALPNVQA